jgi:phosphocarrier protein HPr
VTKKGHADAAERQVMARNLTIVNRFGIHARPAALFVKTASQFSADILVEKDGAVVSGKSIMGLLTLEGSQGSVLKVTATGPDAGDALDALQELVKHKFYED